MDLPLLLAAIANGPVSGQVLADRFGVSRAMVWKGVEALRAEGLGIDPRYRLVDPAGFGPATLAWRLGRPVEFHPSTDSTNRAARQTDASVVVADHQTQGRGRRGRSWESPAGANLLFSLVMRPRVAPQEAPRAVLCWAAAMAGVLGVRVKWPNDLVDDQDRKLGGILAELDAEAERVRRVILGVGLNVHAAPDLPGVTCLAELQGGPVDRAELLARLVGAVEAADPCDLGPWRARAATLGRRVRVGEVEGLAGDVREDGALIVDGRAILAGDVEMIASPFRAPTD